MTRHNLLFVQCLHLTLLSATVSARIVPTFYGSASTIKQNQFALNGHYSSDASLGSGISKIPQAENKFENSDVNSLHSLHLHENSEFGNIGTPSLGNTFGNFNGNADFKSLSPFKEMIDTFGMKTPKLEVDPEAPHIIKVPVPHPYPVHIPVKQPFTVPIFKLVPQEVEKKIPIPVEKLVPVYKEKPVKIIVEKHHPYHVYKPYTVPVPVNTHVLVDKPLIEKHHSLKLLIHP